MILVNRKKYRSGVGRVLNVLLLDKDISSFIINDDDIAISTGSMNEHEVRNILKNHELEGVGNGNIRTTGSNGTTNSSTIPKTEDNDVQTEAED